MLKIPPCGTGRKPTKEESEQILTAAGNGDSATLLRLSSEGVDITAANNENGDPPLFIAALGGQVNIVKALLAAGAPLDIKNNDGSSPLHWAVRGGQLDTLKALLAAGAPIDALNKNDWTPLTSAVFVGHVSSVKYLVNEANADCSKVPQSLQQKLNELLNKEEDSTDDPHQAQLQNLYYQTKHDLGSEELHLLKVLIFGPPGAGKSTLLKVLLGGDPDSERHSTGVCDRKLVQYTIAVAPAGSRSQSVWKELNLENEVQRLRKKIMAKLSNKQIALIGNYHHSSHLQIEKDFFIANTKSVGHTPTAIDEVQFNIEHTSALIACYDSGGQPEFFDVMPALTTIPTGYVMVFDMSKSLLTKGGEFYKKGKKCPVDSTAHYTNAELMKTALANIWSSTLSSVTEKISLRLSRFGQLLVVGTHLDKCGSNNEEQDDKVAELERILVKDILNLPQTSTIKIVERQNKSLIHPISNILKKGRDEIAQEIRTAIENMSGYGKTSEDVPINWLLFQLEIRCSEKHYITHSRCVDIAKKCYINEENVDTILMYFHQLGVLLYYRNIPALQHVVFCSPQWLFGKLTKLIEVKYDPLHEIVKHSKIKNGTFDKNFLNGIYSEDFMTTDVVNYEHLCELFIYLNIMAVLPGETDKYFMPALLNPAPEIIDVTIYGKKIYDTLIVKFENEYIPRGVFCCLVVECMRNAIGWSVLHGESAYKDLIIFQISTDLDLYVFLKDKIDSITFEMYHKSKSPLQMSPDDLCATLYKSLKTVCSQFKISSNFSLGFTCKHSLCDGFTCVQQQLPLQKISVCKRCNRRSQLRDDQMIWFSSLTQKVYASEDRHSVLSTRAAAVKDKEIFTLNYATFCDTMTDIDNLLKYFISANIISTDDQSEIFANPRLTKKVALLLTHISGPLKAGDTKPFRMMLDIMEKHGKLATKRLAISVKKCLMTRAKEFDGSSDGNTEQEPDANIGQEPAATMATSIPDLPILGTISKSVSKLV